MIYGIVAVLLTLNLLISVVMVVIDMAVILITRGREQSRLLNDLQYYKYRSKDAYMLFWIFDVIATLILVVTTTVFALKQVHQAYGIVILTLLGAFFGARKLCDKHYEREENKKKLLRVLTGKETEDTDESSPFN